MLYRLRNAVIIFFILIAAYLLEYSVFIRIPVINCSPNLLLIITFAFAYFRDKNAGMFVGFFAGIIVDTFYCQVIGYNALIFVIIGFFCGSLRKVYYSKTLFSQMLIMMVSDLASSLVYYFVWYVLQSRFAFGYCLLHIILPELCFTLIAGLILIYPLQALVTRMYAYRSSEVNEA